MALMASFSLCRYDETLYRRCRRLRLSVVALLLFHSWWWCCSARAVFATTQKTTTFTTNGCLLYTSPSPQDATLSRMPSSA